MCGLYVSWWSLHQSISSLDYNTYRHWNLGLTASVSNTCRYCSLTRPLTDMYCTTEILTYYRCWQEIIVHMYIYYIYIHITCYIYGSRVKWFNRDWFLNRSTVVFELYILFRLHMIVCFCYCFSCYCDLNDIQCRASCYWTQSWPEHFQDNNLLQYNLSSRNTRKVGIKSIMFSVQYNLSSRNTRKVGIKSIMFSVQYNLSSRNARKVGNRVHYV